MVMISPLTPRQQLAAITTAMLSGFIVDMAFYVLVEFALS